MRSLDKKTFNFLFAESFRIREDLLALYDSSRDEDPGYRFFNDNYCGACVIASYMLYRVAQVNGINLELVSTCQHVWCQLPDGTVVDPTFSQFNPAVPVYIGKRTEFHKAVWWSPVFHQGELALDYIETFWDPGQSPFSHYHLPIIEYWFSIRMGLESLNNAVQNGFAA